MAEKPVRAVRPMSKKDGVKLAELLAPKKRENSFAKRMAEKQQKKAK